MGARAGGYWTGCHLQSGLHMVLLCMLTLLLLSLLPLLYCCAHSCGCRQAQVLYQLDYRPAGSSMLIV
jgi:hypothetical protein